MNHETFRLKVENTSKENMKGTCRIFILPVYDEMNVEYLFEGCRKKAVEIDRFLVNREFWN